MSSEKLTHVVLADTHFLTLEALQSLLGQMEGFTVSAVARSLSELFTGLESPGYDLLVFDPENLQMDSEAIVRIRQKFPHLAWMVLTDSLTKLEFDLLFQTGIRNFIYKNTQREELLDALNATIRGKKYFSDEVLELALSGTEKKSTTETTVSLTSSEIDIVKMIANGLTTKEIALRKNISHHTVNTHRKNIFRKLEVSNSSELILTAIKSGWIDNIEYFI